MHLQTLLSVPTTQKCQILSCDTLVANERYVERFGQYKIEGKCKSKFQPRAVHEDPEEEYTGVLISPKPDQEGNNLGSMSETATI